VITSLRRNVYAANRHAEIFLAIFYSKRATQMHIQILQV